MSPSDVARRCIGTGGRSDRRNRFEPGIQLLCGGIRAVLDVAGRGLLLIARDERRETGATRRVDCESRAGADHVAR
jgi:hypothetical protein